MKNNNFLNKSIVVLLMGVFLMQCSTMQQKQGVKTAFNKQNEIYNAWSLYSKALYYKSNKEYQKAINILMDAATFNEELQRVYYQLSECYFNLTDYETAINYSNLAIKKSEDFSKPYMLLYKIYINIGEYKKAADSLVARLNLRPGSSRCRRLPFQNLCEPRPLYPCRPVGRF